MTTYHPGLKCESWSRQYYGWRPKLCGSNTLEGTVIYPRSPVRGQDHIAGFTKQLPGLGPGRVAAKWVKPA